MKKILAVLLTLVLALSLFGCKETAQKINLKQFEEILSAQPVVITQTELLVQTGNNTDKRYYPDMLTATIQNRTDKVISFFQVAFVAWDKEGKPLKISSPEDKSSYELKEVTYKNVLIESGRYYGKGLGITLVPNHNIHTFKAIITSFKTVDGEVWENPYYETFKNAFVQKSFKKSMMLEYSPQKDDFKVLTKKELKKLSLDKAALEDKLLKLPIQIISSEYIVSGADKDAAPDTIKTTFKNVGNEQISAVTLCLFAFDEAGKAVKLKEAGDNASQGNFTALVEYTTPDFVKDSVFGDTLSYNVHESCGIKYVVAIVKSYTDTKGNTFENPYYIDACLIYEGGELEVEAPPPAEEVVE